MVNCIVAIKSAKMLPKPCGNSLILEVTSVFGFVKIVKGEKMILMVVLRCIATLAFFLRRNRTTVEGIAVQGGLDPFD